MCGRRRVGSHSAREWGRGAPPRSRSAWGPVAGGRRACAGPRCRRPTHASIGPLAAVFLDVAATRWLPCRLLRWSPPFSQCRRPCRSVPTAEWLGGGPAITRCSGLLSRPSRSGLPPRNAGPALRWTFVPLRCQPIAFALLHAVVLLGPARNETQDLNKLRAIHYAQDAIRGKQLLLYSRENNT
ncbi:hypothetical protein U9M48_018036 [Paspalum notatum var. saurae]|uniref:Uncharacterized protein n=1 Tax=Paspalum notatum var. saurae TaxID=547442 RepID=A0AAQ3WQ59_PASNO